MSTWARYAHALVFLAWFGACVYLAIRIVACGSREDRLESLRGRDMTERRDMSFRRSELRSRLDWAARREVIVDAVRRLRLRLRPPRVPRAPAVGMAARLSLREEP